MKKLSLDARREIVMLKKGFFFEEGGGGAVDALGIPAQGGVTFKILKPAYGEQQVGCHSLEFCQIQLAQGFKEEWCIP